MYINFSVASKKPKSTYNGSYFLFDSAGLEYKLVTV